MINLTKEFVVNNIPIRKRESSKFDYGNVLIIAGSDKYAGAAIIATSACVNAGAGLVSLASKKDIFSSIRNTYPEIITIDFYNKSFFDEAIKKADVIAIGPGLSLEDEGNYIFNYVMERIFPHQILLIDASAIKIYTDYFFPINPKKIILTPHIGELYYLLDKKSFSDLKCKEFVEKNNSILVAKSHNTKIYTKDSTYINKLGSPAMATPGMGDMLTGMMAAFLAIYPDELTAVISSVFIHSYIGDKLSNTRYIVLASEAIKEIPFVMKSLIPL